MPSLSEALPAHLGLISLLAALGPASARADEFSEPRRRMVDAQIRARDVRSPLVLSAMEKVPRHLFVPETFRPQAYDDYPLPIGENQTLGDVSYTEYSDRMQYSLSVKISPSKFDSVSDLLKEVGDVKSMSVHLEDVTKRYVELDTRIENREIELERLYELYNMSVNVSDLLQVEKAITRVETELELYKYEKQQLVSKVEKSTFYINLYEEKPATNQLSLTLEGLASMFFGAMSVAITVVVALSGFLLPLALVIGALWLAYKKLFGERRGPRPPENKKIPLPD